MWFHLFGIAILLYVIYRYRRLFKGFENVDEMFPGKPPLPLVGNALLFLGNTHDLYKAGISMCLLYRRSFRLWIGPFLFICLQRPEEIEAVLNNTVHIKKSRIYDYLMPWIQRGLLTSYGDKWKKNRKALTTAFHFQILDCFLDVFNRNGELMTKILNENVGKSSFNVMGFIKMCALDNICETAMGVTISAQENPSSPYINSIKTMCYIAFLRTMRPWYAPDFLFNLSHYGKQQKDALKVLHNFTRDVIEKRINKRKNENATTEENESEDGIRKKKVFLDILLDNFDEGVLTLDEVQEEVDTFMFEGHDTITSAISFALYSLAEHPEYQKRAYEEQQEIFGEDERASNMDELNQMKYLEMVIKESLRLYPSVPVFGRYVEKTLKLDDRSSIPQGAEALLLIPGIHRNPDIWENPNEFNPDRFLPENTANRHPYSYIPFSAGPRNCIGMKFALLEMKATISKVLRKFKLNPCQPRQELLLAAEVILHSLKGVHISLAHRKEKH